MVGVGGGSKLFMGKNRKKFLPILPYIYDNVSDHDFAALVTVRAVDAPERCQLGKAGGS